MNLILFDEGELDYELPYKDPRAVHISEILGLNEGDEFSAGIIGERRGRGQLLSREPGGWRIRLVPLDDSPPLHPVTLVLGCPRPPVARRILKDMSTMGVREIRVCSTDLNEKSYLTAKFWREGRWRDAAVNGAVQGGTTLIPAVRTADTLNGAMEDLPAGPEIRRMALDNDSQSISFGTLEAEFREAVLAVGPERGWSDRERVDLAARGFTPVRLGNRILRTETACTLGVGLTLLRLDLY